MSGATDPQFAPRSAVVAINTEALHRQLDQMDARISGLYWLTGSIGVVLILLEVVSWLVPLCS